MEEKKARKPNWSEQEKIVILQEYSKRKHTLKSKFVPQITANKKTTNVRRNCNKNKLKKFGEAVNSREKKKICPKKRLRITGRSPIKLVGSTLLVGLVATQ